MFCGWAIIENMCDCVPQGRPGGPLPQRSSHQPAPGIHHRSCTEVRAHTEYSVSLQPFSHMLLTDLQIRSFCLFTHAAQSRRDSAVGCCLHGLSGWRKCIHTQLIPSQSVVCTVWCRHLSRCNYHTSSSFCLTHHTVLKCHLLYSHMVPTHSLY